MKVLFRLLSLMLLSLSAMAQLPFFFQRFLPKQQGGLVASASTSYPSSFLFSPASFLSNSPFSGYSSSASSLSPHYTSNFGSSLFSAPSASNFGSSLFSAPSTSNFGSSLFSAPSTSNFGSSLFSAPSTSNFGSSNHFSSSSHPKFAASNVAQSLVDFGTVGNYEGLGGLDQAELIDDYPGFSNAGFGKDFNFAGSQAIKFHSRPPASYGGNPLIYLQREAEAD